MARVLVADDDDGVRFGMRRFLEAKGLEVVEETRLDGVERRLSEPALDLAILDNRFPDGRVLDLLARRAGGVSLPVILLTGHGSIDLAIQAIKLGAEHFLTKPVEMDALLVVIERILASRRAHRQARATRSPPAPDPFVGGSEVMAELRGQALKLAQTTLPVLLRGETGTGKGVLARWIHEHSERRGEPFVDINCAGLRQDFVESELFGHEKGAFTGAEGRKQGLFEIAHRGTLFLDEIGDMTVAVQKKILKVLEEKRFRRLGGVEDREVDVRIVAATHRPLENLIRDGEFRQDLYYRISAMTLDIPPLRRRPEDLEALARTLLEGAARDMGKAGLRLEPDAVAALAEHGWAGNIREMKNVLERAALFADERRISLADLRPGGRAPETADTAGLDTSLTLEDLEARYVAKVLAEENGRIASAARRLGIHRSTLYDKIKRFGLADDDS